MNAVAEERAAALEAFERLARTDGASDSSWLAGQKRQAFERFTRRGLPTTRDEEWRQTSVAPLARVPWMRPPRAGRLTADLIAAAGFADRSNAVVFVDGRYSQELSSLANLPGVTVRSLASASFGEEERTHLGQVPGATSAAFGDLNAALFEDGALVTVAPGIVVEKPIHLVFLNSAGEGHPFVSHPRALVLVGRGSEASVVETHAGSDGVVSFTNAVTEIVVGDGARLDHTRTQREGDQAFHIGALAARLGRDSRLHSVTVSLGAALSRLDLTVSFDGPSADATLDGLFVAGGSRHVDVHSRVEHRAPHCASHQLYRGILDDTARGVFSGLVVVEKGAQKTDAAQANHNLLLSRGALVHSTPQLLILADDVKCKHGATTGQLDEVALFYLRSRGIGEAAARSLLTCAFASEIVQRIGIDSVRASVLPHLAGYLPEAGIAREAFA